MAAEQIDHPAHEIVAHLIVLKQIACDEKCIHRLSPRVFQGSLQRRQPRLTQRGTLLAELRETRAQLPVCGVDELHEMPNHRNTICGGMSFEMSALHFKRRATSGSLPWIRPTLALGRLVSCMGAFFVSSTSRRPVVRPYL